jgi:hypothetical protein
MIVTFTVPNSRSRPTAQRGFGHCRHVSKSLSRMSSKCPNAEVHLDYTALSARKVAGPATPKLRGVSAAKRIFAKASPIYLEAVQAATVRVAERREEACNR